MTKKFQPFGICNQEFTDASNARGHTYTTRDDKLVPTTLIFPENPYNDKIKNSEHILDFGCGVGRNLEFIMNNTHAHYHGIEPNHSMKKYFWELQDKKYENRVTLYDNFEQLSTDITFDVVVITFVFQHIGYRPPQDIMNISDMTKEIRKHTKDGTIWFLLEHFEEEASWFSTWKLDNRIENEIFIQNQQVIPELTHRGNHHLILWEQKEYKSKFEIQSSNFEIEEE